MSTEPREFPPRPLIPRTFGLPIGLSAGAIAILLPSASQFLDGGSSCIGFAPVLVGASILLVSFVFRGYLTNRRYGAVIFLLAGLGLGLSMSGIWVMGRERESSALEGVSASALTFRVLDDPSISESGYSFPAEALKGGKAMGRVRLVLPVDVSVGSQVRVIGRVSRFENDEWGRSRYVHGELRRVKAVKMLDVKGPSPASPVVFARSCLIDALDSALDDARALIAGVSMGRSSELNAGEVGEMFSTIGTSHLIAVSGSHLALVGFLVESVAQRLGASRRLRLIAVGVCCVAFALFTGASASAVRSCLMVLAGMVARLGGRRSHGISSLALAASLFLIVDPAVLFDLGFELSCSSVLAILLFGDYASYVLESLGFSRGLSSVLSITVVSQLASFPLTVGTFGSLSLVAPLSNAIVGPIVSFLLAASVICLPFLLVPGFSSAALIVPLLSARTALFAADLFARIPFASISLSIDGLALYTPWLILLLLYLVWPRPSVRGVAVCTLGCLCVFMVPYMYWDRFAPASVTVLDVGQADCILVREGPSTLLVDAGVDRRALDALVRNNVHHIDAVVVTHWDEDHWGGLPDILDAVPVGRVIVAAGAAEQAPSEIDSRVDIEEVRAGDRLTVNGFSGRVVWPQQDVDGLDNEDSLCIDLSYVSSDRELTMLLTGDAELDQERIFAPEVGDIDVLKCGHHGSKKSLDTELVYALTPEVAVASAGEGNRYGHPSKECRQAVEDSGARFLCTIDRGDIRIEPAKTGIKITAQK